MTADSIARDYLHAGRVMQIATIHGTASRVVSVYYVANDDGTAVYWMSEPDRRHSVALTKNPTVSGAIVIRSEQPVAGLQFAGKGSDVVTDDELRQVIDSYNAKYQNAAKGLYERVKRSTNKHVVYRLSFETLELFDELHFPGGKVVSVLPG